MQGANNFFSFLLPCSIFKTLLVEGNASGPKINRKTKINHFDLTAILPLRKILRDKIDDSLKQEENLLLQPDVIDNIYSDQLLKV